MTTLHLNWTPIASFSMAYAKALGYVFEVHSSPVPDLSRPSCYTVVCRHLDVMNGEQCTSIGEYEHEKDGKLAAEAWLREQLAALGFAPIAAPAAASQCCLVE